MPRKGHTQKREVLADPMYDNKVVTKLINNINSQMVILDRQIVRTEDSLRVVQGQIDRMKEEYAKVVRTLYGLSYNINPMGLLFDSQTYNYSYLRLKYFTEYSRFRRHQATIIRRRQQQFENMTLDLQRQKNEKSSLLAQERKQKDALAKEQKKYQKEDWMHFMQPKGMKLKGEVPDFSEEGWAIRKPRKKK